MSVVIKAEKLSKVYRLGIISSRTISQDLNRFFARVRGKEDPYLKIGESSYVDTVRNGKFIWAVKDLSFEVNHGDILGIVGKNGAGKSTLLKILSRVTSPTTGSVKIRGRVSSLLEVGTGFHQELTGRENIFLNGSILGMSKSEIKRKFDEIVDFSGVDRYIDTPVKRYSSGMYVRLAFAVAAHLEPEILIVDEVLAVGDAEFQKKCIGKMHEVSEKEGKTVLFVSHNMSAVRNLCTKGMLIENGRIKFEGPIDDVVGKYLSSGTYENSGDLKKRSDRMGGDKFRFTGIQFRDSEGKILSSLISGDEAIMDLSYECTEKIIGNLVLYVAIIDKYGNIKTVFATDEMGIRFENPDMSGTICLRIPKFMLRADIYTVKLFAGLNGTRTENMLDLLESAIQIEVLQGDFWKSGNLNRVGNYGLMEGTFFKQ